GSRPRRSRAARCGCTLGEGRRSAWRSPRARSRRTSSGNKAILIEGATGFFTRGKVGATGQRAATGQTLAFLPSLILLAATPCTLRLSRRRRESRRGNTADVLSAPGGDAAPWQK